MLFSYGGKNIRLQFLRNISLHYKDLLSIIKIGIFSQMDLIDNSKSN